MGSVLQDSMRMKHRDVLGLVKKVNNFSLDFTNRYINSLTKTMNNFILRFFLVFQHFLYSFVICLILLYKLSKICGKNYPIVYYSHLLTYSFLGFGQCFGFTFIDSKSHPDPDSD
jgi:hypothetical protein